MVDHVVPGDRVTIISHAGEKIETVTGDVWKIKHFDTDKAIVVLKDGHQGIVIQVENNEKIIKNRIMVENQYSENKENFGEEIMRTSTIPKAVQAFLNSDGGYLYIGIRDSGTLKEKLVGLDYDLKLLNKPDESVDKLKDRLELKIMNTLEKYLTSATSIGSLVKINFPVIDGVSILEITIKKSPTPWFYTLLTNKNKIRKYKLEDEDGNIIERELDGFYIRRGGSKIPLTMHKDVLEYVIDHFSTHKL